MRWHRRTVQQSLFHRAPLLLADSAHAPHNLLQGHGGHALSGRIEVVHEVIRNAKGFHGRHDIQRAIGGLGHKWANAAEHPKTCWFC